MSPKIGRPIKGNSKRDKHLQIRMTTEELNILDECVEQMKSTRTEVVNYGIQLVKTELGKK